MFFNHNFGNIILEADKCISQTKKNHQILKMSVSGTENGFLLIALINSHPVMSANKVKLCECNLVAT